MSEVQAQVIPRAIYLIVLVCEGVDANCMWMVCLDANLVSVPCPLKKEKKGHRYQFQPLIIIIIWNSVNR